MKKILFIIESLQCGGAEKSLVSLLPLLDKSKYEVYLWVMYPGGVFEKLLPDNIHLVHYDFKNNVVKSKFLYFFCKIFYSIVYRLYRILHIKKHTAEVFWKCMRASYKNIDSKYDAIIAYQQGFPTYFVLDFMQAHKKICWINADIFSVGYNSDFNYQKYKLYDYIIPVSEILKRKIIDEWPDLEPKVHTIYDIINPDIVRELSLQNIDIVFDKKKLILLTVGRLVPPKGYDLLLQAAVELRKSISFVWYIIGEGRERTFIEESIRKQRLTENIILLGLKENPFPYMKACDIYVQTSKYEGFGMTVAEAKVLAKPIVTTNYQVVHNIIENYKNGLIVEMTGKAIADGVLYLYKNQGEREKIIDTLLHEENTTYKTEYLKLEKILDED